jgi:hypothetical protein
MNTTRLQKRIRQQNLELRDLRRDKRHLSLVLDVVSTDLQDMAEMVADLANGSVSFTELADYLRNKYPEQAHRVLPEPLRRAGQASMELRVRVSKPLPVSGRKK